jgi:hypothetical protein
MEKKSKREHKKDPRRLLRVNPGTRKIPMREPDFYLLVRILAI